MRNGPSGMLCPRHPYISDMVLPKERYMRKTPVLYIVIPCYNEEKVLPVTAPLFLDKIYALREKGAIHHQ